MKSGGIGGEEERLRGKRVEESWRIRRRGGRDSDFGDNLAGGAGRGFEERVGACRVED